MQIIGRKDIVAELIGGKPERTQTPDREMFQELPSTSSHPPTQHSIQRKQGCIKKLASQVLLNFFFSSSRRLGSRGCSPRCDLHRNPFITYTGRSIVIPVRLLKTNSPCQACCSLRSWYAEEFSQKLEKINPLSFRTLDDESFNTSVNLNIVTIKKICIISVLNQQFNHLLKASVLTVFRKVLLSLRLSL